MFAKISLTAAFFLMAAAPMACASNRVATHQAPGICQMRGETAGVVVAQDGDSNSAATDGNDTDNDSSDNADDNQNDNDQTNQNAAGNDQNAQPSDNDNNNDSDAQQAPQNPYSQQINPNQ
jgi:hypothetical protein